MTEVNTRRLLKIQVAVAVLAVGVTAFSLYQLGPLTQRQAELKGEIQALEAKRNELQRDNQALMGTAKPAANTSDHVDAWLYVGRVSDGRWAPRSDGVVPSPNAAAVQDFRAISTMKNVRLVDNVENESTAAITRSSSGPVQLVKANTELPVLEIRTQPSIGDASYVWVKVSVPADKVLVIDSK